jgi:ATP-dependent Clp protease ATP-binding subunit ClpA
MLKQDLAARHFTTSAIHIIEQLWPRAADRSMEISEQTITMLALWSLLRWERKVGLVVLERMGVEPDALAQEVNQALSAASEEIRQHGGEPKFQDLPSGQKARVVDFNTPLEPLLAAAEHEALALGHGYVGSEHLLLAAIQRACPRLRAVLEPRGVSYHRVKETVVATLEAVARDKDAVLPQNRLDDNGREEHCTI